MAYCTKNTPAFWRECWRRWFKRTLSDENYKALLSFQNGLVTNDRKLTEQEELLRQAGFIRLVQRRETKQGDGYSMTYDQGYWKITALGEDALAEFENSVEGKQLAELQKLRQDFENYRAQYAAYKTAEEHRTKIAERKGALRGVIATLIVTIIGNLFIYYWPSIIVFLTNLFQK